LLDLRETDEYDFWRIKESISYPAANIARDKMIPELFRFKNKANKLIIVYMGDERKGCAAANMMSEKGYENVFLLSGGIEQFNEEFHHLVEGRDVPKPKSHIQEEESKRRMDKSAAIKMRQQ
jgi:centrosomal protein CEP41